MMYRLISFGSVNLPTTDGEFENPAEAMDGSMNTLSGATADGYGSMRTGPVLPLLLRYRALVPKATVAAMRGLMGRSAFLIREAIDDPSDTQRVTARLVNIQESYQVRDASADYGRVMDMSFQVMTGWEQTSSTTVSQALAVGGGSVDVELDHSDGNREQPNIKIVVTAGSAALSSFAVAYGDFKWAFTGAVAAGEVLEIDCGAMSVLLEGADAYDDFDLDNDHKRAEWLALPPGLSPEVTVTWADNDTDTTPGSVDFVYRQAYW